MAFLESKGWKWPLRRSTSRHKFTANRSLWLQCPLDTTRKVIVLSHIQRKLNPANFSPAAEPNAESAKTVENFASYPAALFSGATLRYSLGVEGVISREIRGIWAAASDRTKPSAFAESDDCPNCSEGGLLRAAAERKNTHRAAMHNLRLIRKLPVAARPIPSIEQP